MGLDAASQISSAFQALKTYVGDGKAPAPIDDFITAVKSAASANSAAATANTLGGGAAAANQSQLATALSGVTTAAGGAPPELQGFVAQAAKGGAAAATSTAQGAVASAYTTSLAMPCQTLVADHYPFVAAAPADAPVADLLRVFGMGGQMDSFARDQLTPLLDASGPVWRWRTDNPVAASSRSGQRRAVPPRRPAARSAGLGPAAADRRDRVRRRRHLGRFRIGRRHLQVRRHDAGRPAVELDRQRPARGARRPSTTRPSRWRPITFSGPWALFRLMDSARKQNTGPTSFTATFGQGADTVSFRITLPSDQNPFSRGGLWSFRCPSTL